MQGGRERGHMNGIIVLSKQPDHPRRSYAYVKGQMKIYEGRPELVIISADQIWDGPTK